MSGNNNNNDNHSFVPEDDYEYEMKLAAEERERKRLAQEAAEKEEEERRRLERKAEKEREKQIAKEKLELLQLKNGVIDEEEATIKEEHQQYEKLKGMAWVSNFWYHHKWIILLIAFFSVVIIFITYSELTRERPDLTIMMIADNGLSQRQDELEEFFEKYTDDLDDNGYVHVTVINIPMSPNNDAQTAEAYSQKFLTQVQAGDAMIVITDSNSDEEYTSLMNSTLEDDFPGNKYVDKYGFSFNSKVMAEELKYEYMPNDVHMSIRYPTETMQFSAEEAKENYEKSFKVFKRIVEDITKRCEETNDPGLETEPVRYDNDSEAGEISSDSKTDNSSTDTTAE